ncbi:MAG: hypothetical protein M1836_005459 [Candelina mexicana]|nr:MAG: hypothetical protein M1836_005459 [Candelina mexicana]
MAASAPTWCDDPSLAPAPLAIKRRALPVEDNTPPPPPIPPAPPLPPNEDQIARWSDECAQYLSMLRDWVPRLETVLEDDETPVSSSPLDEGLENPSDAPSSLGVGDDDKHDTDGPLLAVSIVDDSVPGTSAGCGANSSNSAVATSKSGDLAQALATGSRPGGGTVR